MSQRYDLLDLFAEHETVVFNATMLDRLGAEISDPGSATVTLVVSTDEDREVELFTCAGTPEVQQVTGATFQFKPDDLKLAQMVPGLWYYFDIWATTAADGEMHEVTGVIRLRHAGK